MPPLLTIHPKPTDCGPWALILRQGSYLQAEDCQIRQVRQEIRNSRHLAKILVAFTTSNALISHSGTAGRGARRRRAWLHRLFHNSKVIKRGAKYIAWGLFPAALVGPFFSDRRKPKPVLGERLNELRGSRVCNSTIISSSARGSCFVLFLKR